MMKSDKLVNFGIPNLGSVLLIIMVLLTFLQIVLREFFDFSLNWSNEISQFSMSWLTLIGSIWVTKNNKHLNTGLKLHQNLNKRWVCLIDGILALIIAGVAAVVVYQTTIFSFMAMGIDAMSLPWIKMGFIYIALPMFMLATCYYYLKIFFKNFALIFKKD
jgi:TRAP-type C4-dicarboxylate transport system permease small subunit